MLIPNFSKERMRRFPKGDRKALWSPLQRRNPLYIQRKDYRARTACRIVHLQGILRGKSDPGMYFSTGRKVPKAHRGGQSVHEGVAAPDPRILIACARIVGVPR